ncbi:MAG: capsular polysaccharide biosynthesis protein [Parvicellaceae bacterium]|jgi:capsular polysaccharide biosynthesis protein
MSNQSSQDFQSFDLIEVIWKWKWHLLVVFVLAGIISAVVSLSMKEEYLSSVTIYPAKSNTVTFSKIFNQDQSATQFGDEDEAEQAIQILGSAEIRTRIIEKYNLDSVYEISPGSSTRLNDLYEKYQSHVSAERTRFGSVLIKVYDGNPKTAMDMANDLSQLLDTVKNRMIRDRAGYELEITSAKKADVELEVQEIVDTLKTLSEMGVGGGQIRASLMEALANATDNFTRDEIRGKIAMNDKYGSSLASFSHELKLKHERLADVEVAYEQAMANANLNYTHKFVVEEAYQSDRKARPVRWIIVSVATLVSWILALVLILLFEKVKMITKKS